MFFLRFINISGNPFVFEKKKKNHKKILRKRLSCYNNFLSSLPLLCCFKLLYKHEFSSQRLYFYCLFIFLFTFLIQFLEKQAFKKETFELLNALILMFMLCEFMLIDLVLYARVQANCA